MKTTSILAPFAALALLFSCNQSSLQDIGQGYTTYGLFAPWDGKETNTRFSCHSTAERFFFSFEVEDSTLTLVEPFVDERDVDPEDRVEIFFSPDKSLGKGYYCAEIDPRGNVMDYHAHLYRDLDFKWRFQTIKTDATITPWGYRVGGSISREELESLGIDLENGFWMGVFQADFKSGEKETWYSLVPTDDSEPDFHKEGVLAQFRCTPKAERKGVVIYPDDVTTLGLDEWERRIDLAELNLIGLHAATVNDPLDTLEAFIKSDLGQRFLTLCKHKGVDIEYEVHSLEFLLPHNLFETHPDYFRMTEDGQRVADYNMCFSNPEAIEAMRPQLEKLLQWMKPTTHRYFFWADDKQNRYCQCESCSRLSPSEQILSYETQFLKLLRVYDADATLAHLAYHQTLEAPVNMRVPEGIFLEFAPILRDYSLPLSAAQANALKANLLAFPGSEAHILEYWLDESMFSRWHKDKLVPLTFKQEECARDIAKYRSLGATDMTCFATWLNGSYISQYGSTDRLFSNYGNAFGQNNEKAPFDPQDGIVLNEDADVMAHCSFFTTIGDELFCVYYHDQEQTLERPSATTISPVLLRADFPRLTNLRRETIVTAGQTLGDFQQSPSRAPYDPSLLQVGDTLMVYFIGCKEDVVTYGVRPYDIASGTFSDSVQTLTLSYKLGADTVTTVFNSQSVFEMYEKMGIKAVPHNDLLMTSRFIKRGDEWFTGIATAFTPASKPFVIKTKDGRNFDVVLVCRDHNAGACEAAIEIWNDNVYVIVRNSGADLGVRGTFLYKYDMAGNLLAGPLMLTSAQSKPSLLVHNDRLFAFYSADPWLVTDWGVVSRSRMRISEIDQDLNIIGSKDVVNEFGIHYMHPDHVGDDVYMTFTEDRKMIDIAQTRSNISLVKVNL